MYMHRTHACARIHTIDYHMAENYGGVQFSWIGDLDHFAGSNFTEVHTHIMHHAVEHILGLKFWDLIFTQSIICENHEN